MHELTPDFLLLAFLSYIVFLFSTTCHEAAHALVAKIGGDETAALGGQLTLSPVPHVRREPIGMVAVPIASLLLFGGIIGWASAPYNPHWERRYPHRSAWMALAGPATNFLLMALGGVGFLIARSQGALFDATGHVTFVGQILWTFFTLNLLLGVFNLLPATPLDGSTGIMLLMDERTAGRYLDWLRGSPYARLSFLAALLFMRYGYDPIEAKAIGLLLRLHF